MALSEPPTEARLPLNRDVDVVRARQAALRLAHVQDFSRADQARVDLVVAELATNVLRHAQRGDIVIGLVEDGREGLAVVCTDTGPGITLRKSHTGGSVGLGIGLAVVRELADGVEIKSTEQGTWIRATIVPRSR